ncbi:MAG: redoxin domain-containing protein [Acidobacteria bacterium]|nr:redoxin domain-containing protein [Acidobacteriota bacterium]
MQDRQSMCRSQYHQWTTRCVLILTALLTLGITNRADNSHPSQIRLLDLEGRSVEPLNAPQAKAVVLIFTRTDCPISNRYAPEVRRLAQKFAASGINFWLVYPDAEESVKEIRQHVKEYAYNFGALRDPQHRLVKLTGVSVTPEAAIFVTGGKMVYRGRIDDRYLAFGKMRPAPTTHDLEQVIGAILQGKSVVTRTNSAIGCFISDVK